MHRMQQGCVKAAVGLRQQIEKFSYLISRQNRSSILNYKQKVIQYHRVNRQLALSDDISSVGDRYLAVMVDWCLNNTIMSELIIINQGQMQTHQSLLMPMTDVEAVQRYGRSQELTRSRGLPSCAQGCLELVEGFSKREKSCLSICYKRSKFLRRKGLQL